MGEAKRRKAEIEALKHWGPKVDPVSPDPRPTAEMIRRLHSLFEAAKQDGNIDPPMNFLRAKLDTTIQGFGELPIACKKGCSHCCYIWVSASAPELLHAAKIVRERGDEVIARVRAAHEFTKEFSFNLRPEHPYPCPMLEQDVCSIYDSRPSACRLAASADAAVCARSYHNITAEDIPTPMLHLSARSVYGIALSAVLKKLSFSYDAYEFNAGLVRALDTPGAERAWLNGDDVFSGVMRETTDIFENTEARVMFQYAFDPA